MNEEKLAFNPRADILLQLGDQLIKNDNIAITELIKNSYDADAENVEVCFYDIDKPLIGKIIIKDDGCGMDLNTVKNIWMEPGNTHKKEELDMKVEGHRIPIGEKGIGRFGSYKLARTIKLVTRANGKEEICVVIDWSLFENKKYLSDIKINIEEREPEIFVDGKTGTIIELTNLKKAWKPKDYKDVVAGIESITSPWKNIDKFDITIVKNMEGKNWDIEPFDYSLISDFALFKLRAKIKGNIIKDFEYSFLPYAFLSKLEKNIQTIKNELIFSEEELKEHQFQDVNLGEIAIELNVFDKDQHVFNSLPNKDKINNCLRLFSGVRVYRDNLRVYDYGEPDNDWLNMDIDRVNNPSGKLSRNITIGSIFLNRVDSKSLIEKTNREGFIENKAYEYFKLTILRVINRFLTFRNIDKDKIRELYSGNKKTEDYITEIQSVVTTSNLDEGVKNKISTALNKIDFDLKTIKTMYREIAGNTTSYGVAIHEIEKRIVSLNDYVDQNEVDEYIKKEINSLSELIESYLDILRKKKTKIFDINEIVKNAIVPLKYRFKAHNIDYDVVLEQGVNKIKATQGLLVGCVLNLVDNSIYWLKYAKEPKIKLQVIRRNDIVYIVVADNGPGFNIPIEDAIRPFVSGKIEGGMGMGLSLIHDIMEANGGNLIFPSKEEFEIGEEYSGAVVALAFKVI